MAVFAAKHRLTVYEEVEETYSLNPLGDGDQNVSGSVIAGDLCRMFSSFYPFYNGLSWDVTNAATGDLGFGEFYMFDLRMTTSQHNQNVETYSVVAFRVPYFFPKIEISPNCAVVRAIEKVISHSVEFESEEFNRNYLVEADNPKFAYDLLHAQAMNYLLALPRLSWEINGPYIVLTQYMLFDFNTVSELIPTVQKFIELIPDYVRQDIGITPRWTSLFESAL